MGQNAGIWNYVYHTAGPVMIWCDASSTHGYMVLKVVDQASLVRSTNLPQDHKKPSYPVEQQAVIHIFSKMRPRR